MCGLLRNEEPILKGLSGNKVTYILILASLYGEAVQMLNALKIIFPPFVEGGHLICMAHRIYKRL